MIGNPLFKYNEFVIFYFNDEELHYGTILIIDAYGTSGQSEEVSYDIMSTCNGGPCLYKHVTEHSVRKASHTVLCYLEQDDSYLMLLRNKKHDDMNEGKWLGVGGHVEDDESNDQAVVREVHEETGLTLISYKCRGIIYFFNGDYAEVMHLYTSDSFTGILHECDEGTLSWMKKNEICNLSLWEGDRIFLKKMMETDETMEIRLYYENDKLVRSEEIDIPAVH